MFKASEVALQLGISRRHVYSLYQKGELVGYRFGDAVRFVPRRRGGLPSAMPIYYDKSRKRWRYEFSRIVSGQRQRTSKLSQVNPFDRLTLYQLSGAVTSRGSGLT